MSMHTKYLIALASLLMAGSAAFGETGEGWWFRGGPAYRGGGSVKIRGGSHSENEAVTAAQSANLPMRDVGSTGAYANRTYDDGYVRIDDITVSGGAGVPPGYTGNYGYQNSAQYNGSRLTFSRSGGGRVTRTDVQTSTSGGEGDLEGMGLDLVVGKIVQDRKNSSRSWIAGLRVMRIEQNNRFSTYRESLRGEQLRVVDSYNRGVIDGSPVFIPPAPYSGSYGSGNVGVKNIPDSRTVTSSGQQDWTAANEILIDVDGFWVDIRVGPEWQYRRAKRLQVRVSPTVMVGVFHGDAQRDERFVERYADGSAQVRRQWVDEDSGTSVLFGAGIEAGLVAAISRRLALELSGTYDVMFNDATFSTGPNEIDVNPGGYVVALLARYAFSGTR